MRVARRLKREQVIQDRKALRVALRDKVVQQHVQESVRNAWQHGYKEGYAAAIAKQSTQEEDVCQSQTEPSC